MSALIRSPSMMDGQQTQRGAGDASSVRLTPLTDKNVSPLQIFVQAKKTINDIFKNIQEYSNETGKFVENIQPDLNIVSPKRREDIKSFVEKVHGIKEVLSRDHMKVAFFGRTSNGKSTVINSMLRDKILPSGIGHTTNCFLQVEGSEKTGEAYVILEGSNDRQGVQSVGQLAHALCKEKLTESSLVRVFWPREKCPLLRDDVVFVDSPGIDVSPNLDEWIDKHCLDADVFVLVANAESTLMVTEKNFFHKVSMRLSKPNIFILNNRWDASVSELEFQDQVRSQHSERASDFLVKELKVCTREQAAERIFFVSAKEVLHLRLLEQKGLPSSSASLAEGSSARYFEFEEFERKFEECISKSAVKTKFEQHSLRGKHILEETKNLLNDIIQSCLSLKSENVASRKELWEKFDFITKQVQLLTHEMKGKIGQMVDDVGAKVSKALSDEIQRLGTLVDEFAAPFHPDPLVLNVYKKELNSHVEAGLGSNLRAKLSTALALNMENSQREMTDRMFELLPPDKGNMIATILPRREPFEVLYNFNCDNLCADFREDLTFRFSFGIQGLMRRFLLKKPQKDFARRQLSSEQIPRGLPPVPHQSHSAVSPYAYSPPDNTETSFFSSDSSDVAVLSKIALASVASQGTMGGLLIAGLLLKAVGWRVIIVTGVLYGSLYMYERFTFTNSAKEKEFKRQYVDHASKKLKLIVDLTSRNCSHQVQQELSSTFARLCHLVDSSTSEMDIDMKHLEDEIQTLEKLLAAAKLLKNKSNYLNNELDMFNSAYLNGK